jgi:hypothetical protein
MVAICGLREESLVLSRTKATALGKEFRMTEATRAPVTGRARSWMSAFAQ